MEKFYCKFCEKKSATAYHGLNLHQIICKDCGCHSPIRSTQAGAVKAWTGLHGEKRKRD
jgi:hypothetical protein